MTGLLAACDIHKAYGQVPIIKGVSFEVLASETFAIIGPNGAGKTTLFKLLSGEIFPDRGGIVYEGRDISFVPNHERTRLGMARTFQVARVFLDSSALENVVVAIEIRRRAAGDGLAQWYRLFPSAHVREEALHWLESVGLKDRRATQARLLSHGDKKRLELALALALRPKVLLMDEPTAGMSPSDRAATIILLKRIITEQQLTVLITEHDMDVVFQLAGRILVLNYGDIIAVGDPADIRANPLVRDVYLGKEADHA